MTELQIVTGPHPDPVTAFAAAELARYVRDLGVAVRPRPGEAAASVWRTPAAPARQRRTSRRAMPCSRARRGATTCWLRRQPGRYPVGGDEVVGWGVQFLLTATCCPTLRAHRSPNLATRCWRLINDFAWAPSRGGWRRTGASPLAKLSFNEIRSLWPWQSFVHYEFGGVAKRTGCSWFDFRYPLDEHTVGREVFGDATEFENPDLAGIRDYRECRGAAPGRRHHSAAARGISAGMAVAAGAPCR